MAGRASIGAKCIVSSLVIYAEITLVWTLYCAVLLCNVEFRWKITLLFVYMLNLWLHMQNPHYRSYRAGIRNMMLTFDSRPIYRALTYIAVPFLGPQQPRYIRLTLYYTKLMWKWVHINVSNVSIFHNHVVQIWLCNRPAKLSWNRNKNSQLQMLCLEYIVWCGQFVTNWCDFIEMPFHST